MGKGTRVSQRSRTQSFQDSDFVPGEFIEKADPEIDLERGRKANTDAEKRDPKFKRLMEKLRAAAKAVTMFLFL